MRVFLRSYLETLASFATDRVVLAMTVTMLAVSLISLDIYSRLVVRDLPVMACDYDNSMVSRTILMFMDSTREVRVVPCSVPSIDASKDLLIRGEIAAVVQIPAGLSDDVKGGKRPVVLAAIDGSNNLTAKTSYKVIVTSILTVSGGAELKLVGAMGLPKEQAMQQVRPIVLDQHDSFNPGDNYEMYIGPPLLLFFLHLFVLVLAASFLIAPRRRPGASGRIGSLAAIVTVGMAFGLLFFGVVLPFMGVIPGSGLSVTMTALLSLLILDCLLAWALSCILSFEPTIGFETAVLLGMLSLMFSGVTWPTDMFPPAFRWASYAIPFTPFAKGLRSMIPFSVGPEELWRMYRMFIIEAAIYLALGAAGIALARVIKRGKEKSYP